MKDWYTLEQLQRMARLKTKHGLHARMALAALPVGWTVTFARSINTIGGSCSGHNKHLTMPWPIGNIGLHIWLHECGHAHLGHGFAGPSPLHEYQADLWAFTRMREAGVPIPRDQLKLAKYKLPKLARKPQSEQTIAGG